MCFCCISCTWDGIMRVPHDADTLPLACGRFKHYLFFWCYFDRKGITHNTSATTALLRGGVFFFLCNVISISHAIKEKKDTHSSVIVLSLLKKHRWFVHDFRCVTFHAAPIWRNKGQQFEIQPWRRVINSFRGKPKLMRSVFILTLAVGGLIFHSRFTGDINIITKRKSRTNCTQKKNVKKLLRPWVEKSHTGGLLPPRPLVSRAWAHP